MKERDARGRRQMNVYGKPYRTIWTSPDRRAFEIIDQTRLPHQFATIRVGSFKEAAYAISSMQVRGALLIVKAKRAARALTFAEEVCDSDVESCRRIGLAGLKVIKALPAFKKNQRPINVLTHCNAGWLACVDWGSALSPIYAAHSEGIDIHV